MPTIIDTSVWVRLLRDKTGAVAPLINAVVGSDTVLMPQPIRFELLQGCRDSADWIRMEQRLDAFPSVDMLPADWTGAARLSYDSRRLGFTIRKAVDCCIAQIALSHGCRLVHVDQDFEVIAKVRPLQQVRLQIPGSTP